MSKKEPGILLWIVGTRQKPPGEADLLWFLFAARRVCRHPAYAEDGGEQPPYAARPPQVRRAQMVAHRNDCRAVGHVRRESFNQAVPNVGIYSACVFARYCGFRAI